jgi:hypothetical protein
MKKESAKAQKKEVKPVENAKRQSGKRTTLKTAKVAVKDTPKVIEPPPVQQAADAVAVIPPSESNVLRDSTEQSALAAVKKSAKITKLPPVPQTNDTIIVTSPKESKVLRERLGINGYCTETVKLSSPIEVLGCKAEGVVFAKQIQGDVIVGAPVDRILLHVSLVNAAGKRSIVSSIKRMSSEELQALTNVLSSQAITWRNKELKRATK